MSRFLFHLLTVLLIPCFTLYSVDVPNAAATIPPAPIAVPDMPFTYDDILFLLDEIESEDFEERYTHEQVVEIAHFLIKLARIGALPDEDMDELEADIQELLSSLDEEPDFVFASPVSTGYIFAHSRHGDHGHVFLCKKGFVHRCTDHTKHFCHKHKKAVLISVAAVAIAVVTVGVAAAIAGAASVAAGAATEASSAPSHHEEAPPAQVSIPAPVQEAVREKVSALKDAIIESPISQPTEISFAETAREVVSSLAHQVLDGVGEIVAIVPAALEGARPFLPEDGLLVKGTPTENFEKALAQGHQAIDQIFDTNQAPMYTAEAKESRNNMAVGILPPPWKPGNPPTPVSSVKGWKLGDDVTNLTRAGNVPSWDAVRARYWKERAEWAKSNPNDYGSSNISRMEKGSAPQRKNLDTGEIESMELHHDPAQRDGGLFDVVEVWPSEHAELDSNRYIRR